MWLRPTCFAALCAGFVVYSRGERSHFFTPAPELVGNLYSGYSLEIFKHFTSLCKSIVGAVLPFPNTDKLRHGFRAGKKVVASCLHCINCRLNSNLTTNPSPLSFNVSYYHVTTLASHAELNKRQNNPSTAFES